MNGGPPQLCGPFQGSATNLTCPGLNAPPGAAVVIDVALNADYPQGGGADAYGDGVGPFGLSGPSPRGQPAPSAVPAPQPQQSVNLRPVSGAVLVKVPGSTTFVAVASLVSIPVGAVVDARGGRVQIRSRGPNGEIQTLEAFEGQFALVQILVKGISLVTELQLFGGRFTGCPVGQRVPVKPAKKAKSIRHLWAEGAGAFRTKGRYATAAIRGTTWRMDDRCDGTLTRVTKGSVLVRDFVKRKSVVVKAPRSYLAKAPRPRRR